MLNNSNIYMIENILQKLLVMKERITKNINFAK